MGVQLIHLHHSLETDEEYTGGIHEKLFKDFESLFTEGDGAALDLGKLSGQEVDTILLDCLMYVNVNRTLPTTATTNQPTNQPTKHQHTTSNQTPPTSHHHEPSPQVRRRRALRGGPCPP